MPKNDNVKSIRLYESVKANAGAEAADKLAETVYLSKSADLNRKFKWARDVCAYLESNFDESKVKRIRMGCSCTPPPKKVESIGKLYRSSADLDEFCEKYSAESAGSYSVWYEDEALYLSYPVCYCDCVKRVAGNVPRTWCLCTLGYTKKLFDSVLGRDTEVELLESVKTGGSRCLMKITYR